jgi:hypothetical protein
VGVTKRHGRGNGSRAFEFTGRRLTHNCSIRCPDINRYWQYLKVTVI